MVILPYLSGVVNGVFRNFVIFFYVYFPAAVYVFPVSMAAAMLQFHAMPHRGGVFIFYGGYTAQNVISCFISLIQPQLQTQNISVQKSIENCLNIRQYETNTAFTEFQDHLQMVILFFNSSIITQHRHLDNLLENYVNFFLKSLDITQLI